MSTAAEIQAPTQEGSFAWPSGGPRPWKACGGPTRPALHHGYLHRRDDGLWLVMTDSYIAATIRVTGDASPGYVPRDVMKHMTKGAQAVQLSATSWRVELRDGHRIYDLARRIYDPSDASDGSAVAASLEKSGLWAEIQDLEVAPAAVVAFDPQLTLRLMQALGIRGGALLHLTGDHKPMRVTSPHYTDRIGLQMPMRSPGRGEESA